MMTDAEFAAFTASSERSHEEIVAFPARVLPPLYADPAVLEQAGRYMLELGKCPIRNRQFGVWPGGRTGDRTHGRATLTTIPGGKENST